MKKGNIWTAGAGALPAVPVDDHRGQNLTLIEFSRHKRRLAALWFLSTARSLSLGDYPVLSDPNLHKDFV